ncbi:HEAT repeat domain-containing protein [Clostridium bowmanii]|uniref:HEAT repeat domain-containing protein n=1 Tax=Clostridium bowmanii TaxID=132925 RepID=UPI001C0D9351|nr:HEAT repeat domain-containing protein [Clostridium bowmanii]MBU3188920.1 HEAT repeat domain-containing protein [Clostridium bowmanii]MCA1073673.1 HEAT repeat domain-containing protein [Clostridium bowmanii]
MNNDLNLFNEKEMKALIEGLLVEKERYRQEKLAQKIGSMKHERSAELASDLLYSKDAYIRNIAIEILITLSEKSLPILKVKLLDKDRNIRKFALDALKYIKGRQSAEIALEALEDEDENVVEAVLEVIAEHQYKEAENKLCEILKKTSSVWIINALLRTVGSLDLKHLLECMEEKIFSVNATDIEKNILVNTYIRTLGSLGSYRDIDSIINKYTRDFVIDDSNLIFALSSLISKIEVSKLPEVPVKKLELILREHLDYHNSEQILVFVAALVKLQLNFFLDDMEEIYNFNKGEEFFKENIYELIQELQNIPKDFVYKILGCKDTELVLMGLKLIHKKQIQGFNKLVEELCNSRDRDISILAISIITDIHSYKNTLLLEELSDFYEEAAVASVENIDTTDNLDIEGILLKLENKSPKVRKAVAQKLVSISYDVNIKLLQEIVKRNTGEEGIEALEVLFRIDASMGWNFINSRMDDMNEIVRAGLVDIVKWSEDDGFYDFMTTMINDPYPLVRKRAIKVLNSRINDRSLNLLKKLYEDESDTVNKMEIISNLYRFNNDTVLNIIKDAAYSLDTLTRIAAVKALSFMKSREAISVLERMLSDKVEEVIEAATQALCKNEVVE